VNTAFWRGRRVLITGHTGFKGAWLALWLQRLGAGVHGFAGPPPTETSLFAAAQVAEGMAGSTEGDVRDADAVAAAVTEARPEVVVHMAAQALVRRGLADPVATYATNVLGTAHLLEAIRHTDSVRAVVSVTSDKCYLNREWEWGYREDDPLGGRDPYSSSKAGQELVTAAYRASVLEGVGVATARAGNVIGGGDWAADRLLPDLVRAAVAGEPLKVRNPASVRPWQHVLNPLHGYLLLAERLLTGEDAATAFNFGPAETDARPVSWIVDRLRERWPEPLTVETAADPGAPEAGLLKLDSSRARARLGWTPRWDLEKGLDATVAWYVAHHRGEDAREVTMAQIQEFEAG